jgi:hypothetical protein
MSTADAINSQPPYQPNAPKADPWGVAGHPEEESWIVCDSRQDAIDRGNELFEREFWIDKMRPLNAADYLPDAGRIIEQMQERCDDETGSDDPWPEFSDEAEAELTELLRAWAEKHGNAHPYYQCLGQYERIEVTP